MARENVALWRFDETTDAVHPADSMELVEDLGIDAGLVVPTIVDAAVGRGRSFVAADGSGYVAQDKVSGSTLLTRDMSIQVILRWDLAAQNAAGFVGTIYARGNATGVAEYLSAGLELRVVHAALGVGELRWIWQNSAGALKTQIGGHFVPHGTEFTMLTATRRWVSSSEVVLRYYLGDQLIAEVPSADGSIGGGTTGTTQIGTRYSAGYGRFFAGVIDELRVCDYELTAEEIAGTFQRITVHQPRGYELVKELHDPGFPISDDPGSRVQRETRLWGHALGYASAQAANLRENILPDRAYGEVLEQWEGITAARPKPGDSTDARRARVVGHIRADLGASIPGIGAALRELVATSPDNLEIIAFSPTTVDDYTAPITNTGRWHYSDFNVYWSNLAGTLHLDNLANACEFDGTHRAFINARMAIGGGGYQAAMVAKLIPTTIATVSEVGFWMGDRARGNYVLFGLRNTAGTYQFVIEFFKAFASSGVVVLGAAALTTYWMKLSMQEASASGFGGSGFRPSFTAAWSTVSEAGPYTEVTDIASPAHWLVHATRDGLNYAGLYGRTINSAAQILVDWDDVKVRAPFGDRAFYFYVYRDPALPGSADLVAADAVLQGLRQAHTVGHVVSAKVALFDDPDSLMGVTPLGDTP